MNTLENTISMMKALSEKDLIENQNFTRKIFQRREAETTDETVGKFLKPMSREDFYRDLEVSRKQADTGECVEMGEALADIRTKYGL